MHFELALTGIETTTKQKKNALNIGMKIAIEPIFFSYFSGFLVFYSFPFGGNLFPILYWKIVQ